MFIEVTPRQHPGARYLVNVETIKLVIPNEQDDMLGCTVVFDLRPSEKDEHEADPIILQVMDNYDDLKDMIFGDGLL